jgi:NAD(P)-dependent dehydrogenase (short-subunit alcohol dehydrogenase family)
MERLKSDEFRRKEEEAMTNQGHSLHKTVLITGATSGIGLAAARALAKSGCRVIGVGRSAPQCAEAESDVRAGAPGAAVDYLVADLGSQRQIRALAAEVKERLAAEGRGLDVLINNAGVVSTWYMAGEDGYEMQFAVNHLAPFLLTRELLPLLYRSGSARVIATSSGSHFRTRMRWHDVMFRNGYACLSVYKQSKLANVLFTHELNRRIDPASGLRAYAVDPGLVDTSIGEKGTTGIVKWFWSRRRRRGISPEKAAETIVHLAVSAELEDPRASYWKECRPVRPSRYSEREDAMLRLWELSERLCGTDVQAEREAGWISARPLDAAPAESMTCEGVI